MRALLTSLGPLLRQHWRLLLQTCAIALVTAAATVGLLGVAGWFLTATALVAGLTTFNLFVPSALVRALAFTRILARYGERLTGHAATLHLLTDLRKRVFANLLRLDAGQVARWRDGDLVARLTGDIDALDSTFLQVLLPLLVGGLTGVAVVIVLALYVPAAAPAVGLLWLLVLFIVPAWLARRVRQGGLERQDQAALLRQQVLQAVDGHADLLALGQSQRAQAELAATCARLQASALDESRAFATGQALAQAAAGLAMAAVVAAGAVALQRGQVGAAILAGCVLAVAGLFEVLSPMLRGASRLGVATAAAQRISAIERTSPTVRDPQQPCPLEAPGRIEFQDVRFRHHPAVPLIEGLDLVIEPGQRVVITGASGSGKSTLLALMLRLHDPDSGAITWHGTDLRQASLTDLHRRVALLSQDSPVFLGSVRENLCIADTHADDATLWQVLQLAGIADEVRMLPGGLDQWLGEGGRTLSAGQARRLCLARVLLTDADLIVLDEPTEGLDPAAEQALLTSLPQILAGRSLLLVTHAQVPAGLADRCYQLMEGRLVGCKES
ncbi:MAG: thiol reductant ABC exporter subunit CydC [Porticoccaceae bacterium]|nr:thiol reductant ABC exporter subunit CydC [Porticoccaceae bacterium]